MIGPLGRLGAAATLGQHCPQMTRRPGKTRFGPKIPATGYFEWGISDSGILVQILGVLQGLAKVRFPGSVKMM